MKKKRNLHPGKPPKQPGDQPRWRDLKVTEKSAAAGLRREKKCESHTDHLNHWPRLHSLRCLGRGWALIFRIQRSLLERKLSLAVWGQPKGFMEWLVMGRGAVCFRLGSGMQWQREPGESLGLQEKQGAIVRDGERRRGILP